MEKKDSTSKLDLKNEKLGLETSISSQPTNHIEDGNERWRQMSFDDNDHSGYDLVKHTFNCFHSLLQLFPIAAHAPTNTATLPAVPASGGGWTCASAE